MERELVHYTAKEHPIYFLEARGINGKPNSVMGDKGKVFMYCSLPNAKRGRFHHAKNAFKKAGHSTEDRGLVEEYASRYIRIIEMNTLRGVVIND